MAASDHFHSTLFLPQICPLTHTILCLLFTERSCGHPPIASHAQIRRIHGFSVGSIIEYQCVTGYAMRDSDFITCQPGGSWSVSPVCLGVLRFTSWCHRGIFMLQIGFVRTMSVSVENFDEKLASIYIYIYTFYCQQHHSRECFS